MASITHFIGTKINRWTILEDLGRINKLRFVKAKCDCGIEKDVNFSNIKLGKSKSCGCLSKELKTIHGLNEHLLYSVWEGIIGRCYNVNHPNFKRYGAIGVQVCDEWRHDPKSFYDWAIDKWQKGLHLDKDKLSPNRVGRLYCPEYCCFLTAKENSMYRKNSHMIEYDGQSMCVAQWADKYKISYQSFQSRLRYGWTIEEIITTPLGHSNEYYKKLAS